MVAFPPCKINLGLHVVRKRPDGFHDLETCFFPVPFTDVLEIIRAEELVFTTSGLDIPGSAADNLCLKAFRMLRDDGLISANVRIHLHKIVPTGAGLGGGSSDAAHTLRMLNTIFDLKLGTSALESYAARLGSDCAFFIHDTPMMGTGRGEILEPIELSLSGMFLVLLNPGIHVSTADAFGGIKPEASRTSLASIIKSPIGEWRDVLRNDFEVTVFERYPAIGALKDRLYAAGATYAAMTGSGSTVFGIFQEPVDIPSVDSKTLIWQGVLP
jgi:4-diphosphocytidyl-2-C-methyl-D-erythritol kinase